MFDFSNAPVAVDSTKLGLVVLAHGKMLNDEKEMTIISAYDASLGYEMILEHLKDEFAKLGAEPTAVGFSDPMDYDFTVSLAEMKSRAIEHCLSDGDGSTGVCG